MEVLMVVSLHQLSLDSIQARMFTVLLL